ncbi:MAG: MBL fold metallo-hydrolase [Nitrospirae bacterium]|nr:MBL fold metallo-hydrolase [Nitrospirota bacterium]
MHIERIIVGQLDVNCYLVSDEATSDAVIIDPGDESERIVELIEGKGLRPKYVFLTHCHYDHVCAAGDLKKKYNAALIMHKDEIEMYGMTKQLCISWGYDAGDFPSPDRTVKEGDEISIGSCVFKVLHTPGHTPGGVCLYGEKTLFTGDTLFKGSVGRTDLPGGDTGMLFDSLNKITKLPADTRVYCGHGDETTIGLELKQNPFLNEQNRFRFL